MLTPRLRAMIAATVVAVLAIGAVFIYLARADRGTRALCADLADSAGLYAGNAVNIRGVRIGTVTGVSPKAGGVTIRMKVADQPMSSALRVVAVNNSVLADRRIELVDTNPRGGAELGVETCVPSNQTYTPISVSTAFQSFTTLFEKLGGPGDDSAAPVGSLIAEADKQLVGTGGDLSHTFNISTASMFVAAAAGAKVAASAAEAAASTDIVVSMLPASSHVEDLYLGSGGVLKVVKPGTPVGRGEGEMCGGFANLPCADGLKCVFGNPPSGASADMSGICRAAKTCKISGCSGEICADTSRVSACVYRPEYACYRAAKCERQADGKCGFTQTKELQACVNR